MTDALALETGTTMVAILAIIALTAAAVAIYALIVRVPRPVGFSSQGPLCQLVLDGDLVKEVHGPMAAYLAGNADLDDVCLLFDPEEEHLRQSIGRLIKTGTRFDEVAKAADGDLVHVTGQPDGILARVTVYASSPISEALYDIQSQLEVLMQERDRLRRRLTSVPMAMMELDSNDREVWANKQFRALSNQVRAPQELVELMKTPYPEPVEVELPGGDTLWLKFVHRRSDDTKLVTAYPADDQMRAERNLNRFMASLTDTFAHLKVGLAVFDNERRLSLFNPALSAMFNMDAERLIARPSLREFLEALRQKRMVPETPDFTTWRDRITDLDETGDDVTFCEDWSLPSGQVLQVTGRPHPEGALAFLFEDITSSITLERRYRAEIEMGQGTLDSLPDAVAVVDTSGAMILANSAFEQMWQIETMAGLEAPTLNELLKVFEAVTEDNKVWKRLQRFVQSANDREETWTEAIHLKDGGLRYGRFSILASGSAMLLFRDHGSRASDTSDTVDLPAVPLNGSKANAAQQPKEASPAEHDQEDLGEPNGWSEVLRQRLDAFLSAREMVLETKEWELPDLDQTMRQKVRRMVWCLGVSATGFAQAGATVRLSAKQQDSQLTFEVQAIASKGVQASDRHSLAELVRNLGGNFNINEPDEDGKVRVVGTLPVRPDSEGQKDGKVLTAS